MKIDDLNEKIQYYLVNNIMPKIKNPLILFRIGLARGAGKISIRNEDTLKQLKFLGVLDNEEIDVVMLKKILLAGFEASPEFDWFGLVFTKEDAESFFNFIGVK